jgi:acetyl esterase/lipase
MAKGNRPEDRPELLVFLPEKSKSLGAAVVICPGGGYGTLAMNHEGFDIADWLNSLGAAGMILKYRHGGGGYQHPAPLWDAQRAIRTVRDHAGKWNVQPDRVGILGFSAGGHLASTAATHFDPPDAAAKDPVDRQGCRPDFAVLCYAVISLNTPYAHSGSARNLLGPNPDPKVLASLSNETQVTAKTPPTFLWHTAEDAAVPVENSLLFYQAMRKAGVPGELHVFEKGRHGLGLARGSGTAAAWPDRCADWLRSRGLVP